MKQFSYEKNLSGKKTGLYFFVGGNMDTVFFICEILGIIAFSLSGAIVALKSEMDVLGVCTLGVISAIGGGIMRDLLLGITPPTSFLNPINFIVAIIISLCTFLFFARKHNLNTNKTYEIIFLVADSIGLGLFTVQGANLCFIVFGDKNIFLAILSGIITAVGGGAIRDIMAGKKPLIFVKHFYACASIIGAITYAFMYLMIGEPLASIVAIILIIILRVLAVRFHWQLPKVHYSQK